MLLSLTINYINLKNVLPVYFWLWTKYTWNIATDSFFSVTNFGNQNIFKSITWSIYFTLFRVQKYIWSIAQFQQDKILIKVYIIYGGNGLVVSVQVYQTKDPRFKTIRWLKNCLSFHPSKVNLMNIKDSWGLGG